MAIITDLKHYRDRRERLQSSVPSYTLAELKDLLDEWCNEQVGDQETLRWTLSIFWAWLARREKESIK